jgi:hypothetical protein
VIGVLPGRLQRPADLLFNVRLLVQEPRLDVGIEQDISHEAVSYSSTNASRGVVPFVGSSSDIGGELRSNGGPVGDARTELQSAYGPSIHHASVFQTGEYLECGYRR